MRGCLLLAALVCALAIVPDGALAHAFLDRAEPRVGSTIKTAPAHVRLWFTGALESAYSRVQVLDEAGQRGDLGGSALDAERRNVPRGSLPAPPAGPPTGPSRGHAPERHAAAGALPLPPT